ncbi:MAG: hypothetical protein Barrevirus4_6 [Barrevirus sp.]|uniref:Uncharacterized protein n=1 Tax=Barrevirus sp. TaxID=2487763 RepID=A0A3G4ZPT6_9VIRU|nr:MAG: hypothetical protein Barrevirus4_6 [Barrevirus sp.]
MTYTLVDRNMPLYRYSSDNVYDVYHEMLVKIDTVLSFMKDSGLNSVPINSLNFNNLECIVTRDPFNGNKATVIIVAVYRFNLQDLAFISDQGDKKVIDSDEAKSNLGSIVRQIKEKREWLIGDEPLVTSNTGNRNRPTNVKKQGSRTNPIAKLFEDTHKVINELSTKSVTPSINSQRVIPTVESSESESESDTEDSEESEKNKTINVVNPTNLPRPMESILFKEEEEDLNQTNFENLSPETLRKTIDALETLKKVEEDELKKIEEIEKKDTHNFSKFCNNLGDVKREYRKNKEKEEERRNKFEANRNAYRKIKVHLDEGKITEAGISPLFRAEFPIYKFMDEKGLLGLPDDYLVYLNMYDELYPEKKEKEKEKTSSDYIPHNIHYLSDDEQAKYLNMKETSKNIIEEFMVSQCNKSNNNTEVNQTNKKYLPLDKILEQVTDNDDNESFENITFDTKIDTVSNALLKSLQT